MLVVWSYRQMGIAQVENRELRAKQGILTIEDPTRIYILQLHTLEDMHWRWRIYLPAKHKFSILFATDDHIPVKAAFPEGPHTGFGADPGEFTLDAAIVQNSHGKWQAELSNGATNYSAMSSQFTGSIDGAEINSGNFQAEGQILLLRAIKEPAGNKHAVPFSVPGPGVMIWIDEEKAS